MDVKAVSPKDRAPVPQPTKSGLPLADAQSAQVNQKAQQEKPVSPKNKQDAPQYDEKDLLPMTIELNKFFQYLNADIQFELHEKTKQFIVRVVDTKENKVLREFPPQELLDTIANIREYVGVLLDKHA